MSFYHLVSRICHFITWLAVYVILSVGLPYMSFYHMVSSICHFITWLAVYVISITRLAVYVILSFG